MLKPKYRIFNNNGLCTIETNRDYWFQQDGATANTIGKIFNRIFRRTYYFSPAFSATQPRLDILGHLFTGLRQRRSLSGTAKFCCGTRMNHRSHKRNHTGDTEESVPQHAK